MTHPTLSLIAALGTRTRAIGKDNALLWHIPKDLAHFKRCTLGHAVVMGQRTYESIGRPLPGRHNIVLSTDPAWTTPGITVAHSIDDALKVASVAGEDEVFIIGGGSVYAQTIARANRLYLTLVDDDAQGDTFFPEYQHLPFVVQSEEYHAGTPPYTFVTLVR
jgi:dihydrofolate reductase